MEVDGGGRAQKDEERGEGRSVLVVVVAWFGEKTVWEIDR
jgi:hypothetical protein